MKQSGLISRIMDDWLKTMPENLEHRIFIEDASPLGWVGRETGVEQDKLKISETFFFYVTATSICSFRPVCFWSALDWPLGCSVWSNVSG